MNYKRPEGSYTHTNTTKRKIQKLNFLLVREDNWNRCKLNLCQFSSVAVTWNQFTYLHVYGTQSSKPASTLHPPVMFQCTSKNSIWWLSDYVATRILFIYFVCYKTFESNICVERVQEICWWFQSAKSDDFL